MTAISFSGLASGLDTASIVDKLVAAEKAQATTLASKQSDISTQKSIVSTLSSALSSFVTAVRAMDQDSEVRPRTAVVSDSKVGVVVGATAATGTHSFRVKQLATTQVTSSKTFATSGAGVAGTGGLSITVGGTTKSVSWDATDTLDSIASKINDASAGVSASVLHDGSTYRLVVTANNTGTAAAATFADSGSGLALSDPANLKVPPKDAIVAIDGIDVTRGKNVITDALTGVTLTLNAEHATTDAASTGSIALDQKALTDKVKAIVSAYNSVNAALHNQLDYTGTKKGTNTLFGDSALRQLQGSLSSVMSSEYGGGTLGALGLTRDKTGTLTLDETKLTAAIAADSNAVSKVFVSGGFAAAVGTLGDTYTQTSTGIFATKTQSLTDRSTALQKQIDRINTNADALQTRLEAQFTALEKAMSTLQSQSAYLTNMLSSK